MAGHGERTSWDFDHWPSKLQADEVVVNLLDTQVALVEANEGIVIIPSFDAAEFPASLQTYVSRWAGRSGVLWSRQPTRVARP